MKYRAKDLLINFRTFTFGTGVPIEPGWSPKFVIAALVTLIVVVLACAGGAAACCCRKYRRSRDTIQSNRVLSGLEH